MLSGSYDASSGSALKLQIGEGDGQTALVNIAAMDAKALGLTLGSGTSGGGGSVTKMDGSNIASSFSGTPGFAVAGETISLTYTQGTTGSTGYPATTAEIGFSEIGTYNMRINLGASSDAQFSIRINGGAATVFTTSEIRDWNSGIGVVTGTDFYHLLQSKLPSNVSERTNSGTTWWYISSMTTGSSQSIQVDVTGSVAFERSALGAILGNLNPSFSAYGSDAVAGTPATPSIVTMADNSGHSVDVTVNDSDTSFSGTGYFSGLSVSLAGGRQLNNLTGGGSSSISFAASGGGAGGGTSTGGIDVSTSEGAQAAIPVIDNAISTVLKERSNLGALQNRLEHTINNLGTANENLSDAESRIRDTDMAMEMMEYTKGNILSQAVTSMLAQANQLPQQVLQLLG